MKNLPTQVQAIGMVWYHEADYDRLKSMFIDGHVLPRTFLQWQDLAEQGRKRLVRQGHLVVKAYIDRDKFPDWCLKHGHKLDSGGRNAFGNAEAARIVLESQRNSG